MESLSLCSERPGRCGALSHPASPLSLSPPWGGREAALEPGLPPHAGGGGTVLGGGTGIGTHTVLSRNSLDLEDWGGRGEGGGYLDILERSGKRILPEDRPWEAKSSVTIPRRVKVVIVPASFMRQESGISTSQCNASRVSPPRNSRLAHNEVWYLEWDYYFPVGRRDDGVCPQGWSLHSGSFPCPPEGSPRAASLDSKPQEPAANAL